MKNYYFTISNNSVTLYSDNYPNSDGTFELITAVIDSKITDGYNVILDIIPNNTIKRYAKNGTTKKLTIPIF